MKKPPVTWLIDLDNTLHNASHAIFPVMHDKMNAYIAQLLGDGINPADAETVDAARLFYWKKYGATLLGLIEHHQVNAAEFLQRTHDFNDLPNMIRYESGLKNLLKRLPGNKILFTNAPRDYAQKVLKELGLQHHFDQHISIESMRVRGKFRPKPSRVLLKRLIRKRGLKAGRCVLIEDSRDNLKSAKYMGMKTVWVTQYVHHNSTDIRRFARPGYIDIKIRSIKNLPAQLFRISTLNTQ